MCMCVCVCVDVCGCGTHRDTVINNRLQLDRPISSALNTAVDNTIQLITIYIDTCTSQCGLPVPLRTLLY